MGTNIRTGDIKDPYVAINTAANVASPLLDIATLGGGTLFKGVGVQAFKQAGGQTLKQTITKGALGGAGYGALFGGIGGLSEGDKADIVKGIEGMVIGGTLGGAIGGGIAGASGLAGKVLESYKKLGIDDKVAKKETVDFFKRGGTPRDTRGRYTTENKSRVKVSPRSVQRESWARINQQLGRPLDTPVYPADLDALINKELGLPDNFDIPQMGLSVKEVDSSKLLKGKVANAGLYDTGKQMDDLLNRKIKIQQEIKQWEAKPILDAKGSFDKTKTNKLFNLKNDLANIEIERARLTQQSRDIMPGNESNQQPLRSDNRFNKEQGVRADSIESQQGQTISSNSQGSVGKANPQEVTRVAQPSIGDVTPLSTDISAPVKMGLVGQPQVQTPRGTNIKLSRQSSSPTSVAQGKQRGFTTSVQESANVQPNTKLKVAGTYKPKPNTQLMGEAQALLQDGATIDIKNVQNVDQKVAATIQEAVSQQGKNPQLAANLFNNLSEQGTELGRGVQAFSLLNKMSPEAVALSAAGKIKAYNRTAIRKIPELSGDQVKLISDKVAALSKLKVGSREHNIAVNELSKTINEFIPSSLVDKAITVWKAGLLTSLRTHERNLLGNTIMSGAEVAKDVIASPVDKLMSLVTGKRSLVLSTKGTGSGVKEGMVAAKDIIQKGYDPEATIAKFDQKNITWGDNWLEQALKRGTDTVFRTLGAEDKVFLHGATARSLYEQAKVAAINAGKQGDKSFIEKLIANPTEEMIKIAERDANYATFHDKNMLTGISTSIKNAVSNPKYGAWGEFGKAVTEILAPFTGVPSSIVGKTLDYSPIGLTKGTINVSRVLLGHVPELQRQAAQEISRGVIGSGLFALGSYLMSKGLMTGQPKDTTEANLWAAQGKQSNSVLINGQWRSINSVGPQNLVMLAGAKYQEEMSKEEGSFGAYAGALGKDQLSQTFLAGVQGPLNAITDPARYGQSYVGNQTSSIVPNIVKDTAKALDPSQRENNSIQDYFTNSIPGLRNQNVEKRDVLGNVMPQEPTGAAAYVDLFNSKTPINNTITNELARLNASENEATPSKMNKSQTINKQKVKLTPQELNNFEAGAGQIVRDQLNKLIESDSYKSLSDEDKAKMIDKTVSDSRAFYKKTNSLQGEKGNNGNITLTTTEDESLVKLQVQNDGKTRKLKDNRWIYSTEPGKTSTLDLRTPTKGTGIGSFANKDWQATKAVSIWNDSKIPEELKTMAFKELKQNPEDVRYAALASYGTDVSTQYILSKSPDHDKLLENLLTGRVVGIKGEQFANNSVIDQLYNEGHLSADERKALKAIKVDKEGNSLTKAGGKKAKKIKLTISNSTSKIKPINLKLSKPPKPKSTGKSKTLTLSKAKTAKPAKFKVAKIKTKFSKRPSLTLA